MMSVRRWTPGGMGSPDATRILIADDHPLFLGALRQALTGAIDGAEIFDAADLESLLATLERTPDMDLVLLDLAMPGVRGFSGLMYLRAQHASVPVIVVSANEDRAVMRRCLDFGASGYIPKSLDVETMRAAVRMVSSGGRWAPADLDLSDQRRIEFRGPAALIADPAAGARADDAVGGPVEQADRLRTFGVGGDDQGACVGDFAETRRRKPNAGGDRRRQYRKGAMARKITSAPIVEAAIAPARDRKLDCPAMSG